MVWLLPLSEGLKMHYLGSSYWWLANGEHGFSCDILIIILVMVDGIEPEHHQNASGMCWVIASVQEVFLSYIWYKRAEGNQIRFSKNLQCGNVRLIDTFPVLFVIWENGNALSLKKIRELVTVIWTPNFMRNLHYNEIYVLMVLMRLLF